MEEITVGLWSQGEGHDKRIVRFSTREKRRLTRVSQVQRKKRDKQNERSRTGTRMERESSTHQLSLEEKTVGRGHEDAPTMRRSGGRERRTMYPRPRYFVFVHVLSLLFVRKMSLY